MRSWWIWRAGIVTLAYRLRSSFPCVRPSHLAASFVGSHEIHRAPHRWEQRSSEDVREFVAFVETSTEFGGRRQWFRCLSCGNKCRILYGGAYFRCRRCYRLKYEMQYEPPFGRIAIRALKIRERLRCKGGIGEPFPPKPKGMHLKTYERLRLGSFQLQNAWSEGIMGWLQRTERRWK